MREILKGGVALLAGCSLILAIVTFVYYRVRTRALWPGTTYQKRRSFMTRSEQLFNSVHLFWEIAYTLGFLAFLLLLIWCRS